MRRVFLLCLFATEVPKSEAAELQSLERVTSLSEQTLILIPVSGYLFQNDQVLERVVGAYGIH
jgi:hypothetical protein